MVSPPGQLCDLIRLSQSISRTFAGNSPTCWDQPFNKDTAFFLDKMYHSLEPAAVRRPGSEGLLSGDAFSPQRRTRLRPRSIRLVGDYLHPARSSENRTRAAQLGLVRWPRRRPIVPAANSGFYRGLAEQDARAMVAGMPPRNCLQRGKSLE
jgi:hypothetical protein